jgi:hypothetical protein
VTRTSALMKSAGVTLLVALVMGTAPLAVHADPLRTMTYRFDMDSRGFGGSPEISGHGTMLEGGSFSTNARSGKITVEVQQATADGGLVIDLTEMIDRADKPLQTIRCGIYGATSDFVCSQDVPVTNEERILLAYLGRQFFDPSRLDDKSHWHSEPKIKQGAMDIENDYTVTKVDGDVLTIAVDREERNGGYKVSTSGTLVYDAALDLPDSVKVAVTAATPGGQADMNVELRLVSDSMAKKG